MTYQMESRTLPEQPAVVMQAVLPVAEVGPWLAQTYAELFAHLEKAGVPAAGPPYARYVFDEEKLDIEAGVPIAEAVPSLSGGPVRLGALPGGPAVSTVHAGPYETLDRALAALDRWLAEHGYEPAGPHWEVYRTDPAEQPEPAAWQTLVVRPYRPQR